MPRTWAMGSANAKIRAEKGLPPLDLSKEEIAQYEEWAMGNCSHGGVQPQQWDQRPLLVQDPFIWQKVRSIPRYLRLLTSTDGSRPELHPGSFCEGSRAMVDGGSASYCTQPYVVHPDA
jgi:hypothetical protein